MNKIEELIVERALDILYGNDRDPEVGMGMFPITAVRAAVTEVTNEAKIWGKTLSADMYDIGKMETAVCERRRR